MDYINNKVTVIKCLQSLIRQKDNLGYLRNCGHHVVGTLYDLLSSAPDQSCRVKTAYALAYVAHHCVTENKKFV